MPKTILASLTGYGADRAVMDTAVAAARIDGAHITCLHVGVGPREAAALGITCNTIALARRTHQLIAKEGETDAYLSIGRCREIDKEAARSEWWDRAKTGRRAHAA